MKGIVRVMLVERNDGSWSAALLGAKNDIEYTIGTSRTDALERLRQQLAAYGSTVVSVDETVLRLDVPVEEGR